MKTAEREKRAHPRVPARIRASVILPDGSSLDGYTRDISLGGAFVELGAGVTFGTQVTLLVHFPSLDAPAQIPSTARWSTRDGVGFAFGSVRAQDTWAISQITAMHGP